MVHMYTFVQKTRAELYRVFQRLIDLSLAGSVLWSVTHICASALLLLLLQILEEARCIVVPVSSAGEVAVVSSGGNMLQRATATVEETQPPLLPARSDSLTRIAGQAMFNFRHTVGHDIRSWRRLEWAGIGLTNRKNLSCTGQEVIGGRNWGDIYQ